METQTHPSDADLREYAATPSGADEWMLSHLLECVACAGKVAAMLIEERPPATV